MARVERFSALYPFFPPSPSLPFHSPFVLPTPVSTIRLRPSSARSLGRLRTTGMDDPHGPPYPSVGTRDQQPGDYSSVGHYVRRLLSC